MNNNDIQERVKKAISRVLKMAASEISDDANFIFDLGADSMQSLELVAALEEEFDIEMDEDKALEVQSVSDAVSTERRSRLNYAEHTTDDRVHQISSAELECTFCQVAILRVC